VEERIGVCMRRSMDVDQSGANSVRLFRVQFCGWFLILLTTVIVHGQVSVTTWHNDTSRTGQNLNETILSPSNVNPTLFGKLFSQTVDGFVYAQPLYLPNLTIGGTTHNVLFIATEHDTVYAFDADNNGGTNASPLWKASLLSTAYGAAAGATTVPSSVLGTDIQPEIGITGTPVIDPASGTLYVVSKTEEGSSFVQRLHALDVTSGAEKFGGPVVITATVDGTGNGSSSGKLTFDSEWENQRPGLLLLNGVVYIGFAAHGDVGPWHGWILGYSASTLKQTGAFCTSPNGVGGGFWMSGAALSAEVIDPVNHPFGRMYVATGNGDYTATKPYAAGMDYGDSILNLDLTNGVPTIQDEFTPKNQATMDSGDGDLGSSGVLILPNQTTGSYPHLAVLAGKPGEVYLLNREGLGGYDTSADQVVQELPSGVGQTGTWTMPAYWNGSVYYAGRLDYLKAFPLVNGLLTGPTIKSTDTYAYPGANPSISANGNSQGVIWTINSSAYPNDGPSVLEAYDATKLGAPLYTSSTNSSRDSAGPAVKFTLPTIANGKVYVGAQKLVSVYGQLSGAEVTATPFMSPDPETYTGTVSVSISDATAGSTIYYTLDGSTPTESSAVYSTSLKISDTTTVNAIATASGYDQSAMISATYTLATQTATPSLSPGSETISQSTPVTISDATSGATIYFTTDGSTPTTASTKYTGPVSVDTSETLNAIAVVSGYTNSEVGSASYTLDSGETGINFPSGFADTGGIVILNGSADLDDSRLQMTDGGTNEASSAWYYEAVNIQAFTTTFSFQLSNPAGNGITFAIQGNNTAASGSDGSGLGYQGITQSIAVKFDFNTIVGAGQDSTGLFTNGAEPTTPAIDLSSTGINLKSDDTMDVTLAYNGSILSMTISDIVTGAAYTTSWTVNIPSIVGGNTAYVGFTGGAGTLSSSQKLLTWAYNTVSSGLPLSTTPIFSPPGGTYTSSQTVSMSSLTSGALIYYTTNGTTPTTSSTVYSKPITVSSSSTVKAIAQASGYSSSSVGTESYTIGTAVAAPAFSIAGGTYTAGQVVSLTDATPGTKIYYTTDGTSPTASSTAYTRALQVSQTEVVSAIGITSGAAQSPVAKASYTINLPAAIPAFSPSGGHFNATVSVTILDGTAQATIYYTTDGTTPTVSSKVYTGAISVDSSTTLNAIAIAPGYSISRVITAVYTFPTATPTMSPAGGTYTTAQSVTLKDVTTGASIYYTLDGTNPTTSSTLYTGPITVNSTETIKANAVAPHDTQSSVVTAKYTF